MERGSARTTHDIEARNDRLASSIRIRFAELLSPEVDGNACIYIIPKNLRDINEKSYTPRVVSLGPYTHGMTGLESMEDVKLGCLQAFEQSSGMSIENLVKFMRDREERARACYASLTNFSSDEFVKIILVDVAFVLTLLGSWRHGMRNFSHFEYGAISREDIWNDLYLLENQLPLFLLQELFEYAPLFSNNFEYSFPHLLREFIYGIVQEEGIRLEDMDTSQYRHLVDLFRQWYKPSNPRSETSYIARKLRHLVDLFKQWYKPSNPRSETSHIARKLQHLVDLFKQWYKASNPRSETSYIPRKLRHLVDLFKQWYKPSYPRSEISYIPRKPQNLTELHKAGVKFKPSSSRTLVDIQFKNGVLEIPRIQIEDSTEPLFRNILAFEQCHRDHLDGRYIITDYIVAMNILIKTPRDAKLLAQHGILQNRIGDNMQVSKLFHELHRNIYYNTETFYYARLFEQLDEHCKNNWNKWYALLKHEYFKNPWKIIAVVAATLLLLFSFINTVCSIISVPRS